MKKLLVFILAAFIAMPAFSQINFGLKAGLSTTSITMEDLKTISSGGTDYTVEKLKGANFGFHGGAFVRVGISKLYIQPELLFTNRTNEYTVANLATVTDSIVKQKFNKLEIPLMIGLKFGPVRINAGPSAAMLINSPADLIKDPDFKTMYAKMTFGYQAGVGLDLFQKLTVDLRYEGSLTKYQNQIENLLGTKVALDDRPNAFLLSVGIMF
ncbi:MAG: PorT family protein [Bacteroidales bacterium]|nr:PorT family protein [Bacteroidales bacterium]